MKMSNSSLISYTRISPNSSNPRNNQIKKITIHHMAGNLSVETCGRVFAASSRRASSNYGVGTDGRIGMYVEERNRSWCSSSANNDNQAITIEVANDGGAPDWHVSDKALASTIDLCVDICKRNGIARLNYTGNADGNLTEHNYFSATACPGPYLKSKLPYIAQEVNKRLESGETDVDTSGTLYRVQAGAFSDKKNAESLADKIENEGFQTCIVKQGDLYKVQVGAFSSKENANRQLISLKEAGFEAFITSGASSADEKPSTPPPSKSVDEIAKEVLDGKWGNGTDRKNRLTAAGYDYDSVQKRVNEMLGNKNTKSIDEIAKEVIAGKWGNGADRKARLTSAGYDYDAVQKRVNEFV